MSKTDALIRAANEMVETHGVRNIAISCNGDAFLKCLQEIDRRADLFILLPDPPPEYKNVKGYEDL